MKRGAKYFKKILAFLSQDFFGDGVPFEVAGEGEVEPSLPSVKGKLLEALECAFVREFLGSEWKEEEKNKKEYSLPFWSPKAGWNKRSDGTVSHRMHLPGADDWEYIEPFEEDYGLDDIFYNYLGVGDGAMIFDLAMTGRDNLPFGDGGDVLSYFKEGSWEGDARETLSELYGDMYDYDEGDEDEDEDEACDPNVLYGRFYAYHLTVAPLPEEILKEMIKSGFDFGYFNNAAGGILDIMTCYEGHAWANDDVPADLTAEERIMVDVAASSLFGYSPQCIASFKTQKVAEYLNGRKSFSRGWREVLDGFFRLLTGCDPKASGSWGGRLNGRYYVEERFFVADGEFYCFTQLPRDCLITPGRRLALAAFISAYDEAVIARNKKNASDVEIAEGRAC